VARHILHLAMPALREPLEKPRLRRRQVGLRDTDRLETELAPPGFDLSCQSRKIHA